VVGSFLTLAGCATVTPSDFGYAPPGGDSVVKNESLVSSSFDETWDRLVARLSSSFFVINNIDKASRLINVSFTTEEPQQYLNCGTTTRHFEHLNENRDYSYPVAGSSNFKVVAKGGPYHNLAIVGEIARRVSLEGRINVYVAPVDKSGTRVLVNAKYVMTIHTTGVATQYTAFGTPNASERIPDSNHTISLSTTEPTTKDLGTAQQAQLVKCESTGVLESKLLALAQ
jgi:hypothetical protein